MLDVDDGFSGAAGLLSPGCDRTPLMILCAYLAENFLSKALASRWCTIRHHL